MNRTHELESGNLETPIKFQRHQKPTLSVVIPAYNEENTIARVINDVRSALAQMNMESEILVIDDGSEDETRNRALDTEVTVISNGRNRGKGVALRKGFLAARGTVILTVDGDGAHRPEDIQLLVEEFFSGDSHILIGSRFLKKYNLQITSPTNVVGNKIFNLILEFLSLSKISDSQSGLRIIRGSLLSKMMLSSDGYEIETEMTAKALGLGLIVKEIPIRCRPRLFGTTHLNAIKDGVQILKTLICSYMGGLKRRKDLRQFN